MQRPWIKADTTIDTIHCKYAEIMEVAERVGFEPTVGFPRHSLSRRAPSTARTPLRSCGFILAEPRRLGNDGSLARLRCGRVARGLALFGRAMKDRQESWYAFAI